MFKLPELAYAYDALDRSIDARTMEIHHQKHHGAYVTNLNKALEIADGGKWLERPLEDILRNLAELPEAQRAAVRNNGGGHYNHSLFWRLLSPDGGGKPTGDLGGTIANTFGSFEKFKEQFSAAALGRFGSGWAWLTLDGGKLAIASTPNQDNPLMDGRGAPLVGLDVWEHAYYLRYQNRRADYVNAFWDVVSWAEAEQRFQAALRA
ncbi:MAG TPA: superoxide dismutase [Myxococcota bacterium]|nr:superoxide dismutase [Myxococcota bacterium]HRY92860.1 superoxide dismutase [Myxococcota bacterium]HSA22261.1 superoxide dismutase [Myxococcota bacterium]